MLRERWHFCRDGRVLLGSRALRERHLGLMGYQLLPVRACPPCPSGDCIPPHTPQALWVTSCPLPRSYPSRNWSHREACPSSRATYDRSSKPWASAGGLKGGEGMHTGFRMAPLWGVDNLHFGSLCFGFSLKSLSFYIAHLVSGVGCGLGPPPTSLLFITPPHPHTETEDQE